MFWKTEKEKIQKYDLSSLWEQEQKYISHLEHIANHNTRL